MDLSRRNYIRVCVLLFIITPFLSFAAVIERVSETSVGVEADSDSISTKTSISSDGRYVTFQSDASNLVAGDTNGFDDIFVYDRDTDTIERVSVTNGGFQSNGPASSPAISGDGRYVTFQSDASNLVAGDTNGFDDIFVYDRDTDTIERVSVTNGGVQSNGPASSPAISSDGRYVTFQSDASNLVVGDTNGLNDIFVYDRDTDTIERVSVTNGGVQGNGPSSLPTISGDGRYVAFESFSDNFVATVVTGGGDIYVYDRDTDTIQIVSIASDGTPGDAFSANSFISENGRFVTFLSGSTNLVADDSNNAFDIFVYDRDTDTIERVSETGAGVEGNNPSFNPVISGDGRYVAFNSFASNFDINDTNNTSDIFVYDRDTDTLERVSETGAGVEGNDISGDSAISSDGAFITFFSAASNLVLNDTNELIDVFLADNPLFIDPVVPVVPEDPVTPPTPSSETRSGSRRIYSCKNPEALNYDRFGTHQEDMCEYNTIVSENVQNKEDQINTLKDQLANLQAEIAKVDISSAACPHFTGFFRRGDQDDEIKKWQIFLNKELSLQLSISGYYGAETEKAIRQFQAKYPKEILEPWGISEPTGYLYKTTRGYADSLFGCSTVVDLDGLGTVSF